MVENPNNDQPVAVSPEEKTEQEKEVKKIIEGLFTRIVTKEEEDKIAKLNHRPNDCLSPEPFSKNWEYAMDETSEIFSEKLNDKILVDLGGGRDGLMKQILKEKGITPRVYANIDFSVFNDGTHDNTINLNGDMLSVLLHFIDNSVDGISINGIDDMIIDNDNYHNELAKQIKRVLKPGGIVFGLNSDAIHKIIKDFDFNVKWKMEGSVYIWTILEKKKILKDNLN